MGFSVSESSMSSSLVETVSWDLLSVVMGLIFAIGVSVFVFNNSFSFFSFNSFNLLTRFSFFFFISFFPSTSTSTTLFPTEHLSTTTTLTPSDSTILSGQIVSSANNTRFFSRRGLCDLGFGGLTESFANVYENGSGKETTGGAWRVMSKLSCQRRSLFLVKEEYMVRDLEVLWVDIFPRVRGVGWLRTDRGIARFCPFCPFWRDIVSC